MKFDEWLYEVCVIVSRSKRCEVTDAYSSMDLTDAKYGYLDGMTPEEYSKNI